MNTFRARVGDVIASDFTPNERLVLIVWLTHANPEGIAWPSIARLATLTALSARSVRRSLKVARTVGTLEDIGRRHGALVLRYRSCPQRPTGPRTPAVVPTGPQASQGLDTVSDKQLQENKTNRTKPYPYPLPSGEGDRDQVAFILEWARDAQADEAWWQLAVEGNPGAVHQVCHAMEESKKRGGYRGSLRYRSLRASLARAFPQRTGGAS